MVGEPAPTTPSITHWPDTAQRMDSIEVSRHDTPAFGRLARVKNGHDAQKPEKYLVYPFPSAVGEKLTEIGRQIDRFLIGGNAGGTIATLSLIAGIIGYSPESRFPQPFFWVLVVFITGLLASWINLLLAHHAIRQMGPHYDEIVEQAGDKLTVEPPWVLRTAVRMLASLCLAGGTIGALVLLFQRTA